MEAGVVWRKEQGSLGVGFGFAGRKSAVADMGMGLGGPVWPSQSERRHAMRDAKHCQILKFLKSRKCSVIFF